MSRRRGAPQLARRLNGSALLAKVIEGVVFIDGEEKEGGRMNQFTLTDCMHFLNPHPQLLDISHALDPRALEPLGFDGYARDTLWHRRLIARKYDGSKRRLPGRPSTPAEIRDLILEMAQENSAWGYTRIQGALKNLRREVGRGTIAKVMKAAGIDSAPERRKGTTWKESLREEWALLGAIDFFTVEVWTAVRLVRYHVLFVLRLATRHVQVAGIIPEPHGR